MVWRWGPSRGTSRVGVRYIFGKLMRERGTRYAKLVGGMGGKGAKQHLHE